VSRDHPPGWRIETTLVPELQDAAEAAITRGLRRLGDRGLQAALVALDPATGDVLAMVGGRDASSSPFNRAVRSRRQPGSAFKPFVYAAALERGSSPVSVLEALHSVRVSGKEEWTPRNVSTETPDRQTLREALFQSNNQAAALLQQQIGSRRVLGLASAAGLDDLPDVPSLALGSGLVTPLDLTAAYAVFANGGHRVEPRGIRRVLDDDGDVVYAEEVRTGRRVLSEASAFQVLTMLRDVVDVGTGSRARELGVRVPAAGKTGTTNDFRDAWFVGFTSAVVVGVWVGFDQPAPIADDAYGARVALPIWADFVRNTERRLAPQSFKVPPSVTGYALCRQSYQRAVKDCPAYTEYLKHGDEAPRQKCERHRGGLGREIDRAIDSIVREIGKAIRGIFD
jgi:membrane carboxypeptidase/penicillin-binding protein